MLVIVSSAKPDALHKILNPILKDAPVKSVVRMPDDFLPGEGKAVLLMGKGGFQHLVDTGIVKAKQKVGSSREKLYNLYNKPTLVTYDPNILNFMPELQEDINWDIRLAVRLATTGSLKPQVGHYEWVPDLARAFMWAYQDADKNILNPVAIDLETVGLDEFNPQGRILTVQVSWKVGHSIVYRVPSGPLYPAVKEQLEYLFNCPWINIIGANLKYDMRWLWTHWGLEIKNHKFDTQLVGGLLNENRHNSLKKHIKEYAEALGGYENTIEDKWDKARMDIALEKDPEGFLQYAGGDTDGCLRIYTPMKQELIKDEKLAKFYTRLLHPASIAFRKLESRGIKIDKQRYLELKAEAETERDKLSSECFSMVSNHIKYKYAENLTLNRPAIIVEHLFGPYGLNLKPKMMAPSGNLPSRAYEHLKQFADHPIAGPFVKKYKEYRVTCKTLDTYINGFLEHLRSDGYFHPSYILAKGGQAGDEDEEGGTVTGRSSCRDPAWQTLVKRTAWAKKIRSVVVPPKGHVIVVFDFSQGELRIMADMSGCKVMIEAYHKGLDLHAITAANMMNLTLEQFWELPEDQIEMGRFLAKACNFGLIFRVSPEGLRAYAASSYGVIMTEAEAVKYHTKWFEPYPEIQKFHEIQVKVAKKFGFVRSPLGRVRHLPLINSFDGKARGQAERQSINSPVQSTLFDMMMLGISEIDKQRGGIHLFGCTHDSLEIYLKEETWEQDAKQIKGIMENLPLEQFGWSPKIPFVVDCQMSTTTLADLKKVKL